MKDFLLLNPIESVYSLEDENSRVQIVRKHIKEDQKIMFGIWSLYTYIEFAVVVDESSEKGKIKFSRLIKHNNTKAIKISVSYGSGCTD